MTVPTVPRRWREILNLAVLTFGLTATHVTGVEICNNTSQCGYGSRCDRTTDQCVCQSESDTLQLHDGNPFNLIYCLGCGLENNVRYTKILPRDLDCGPSVESCHQLKGFCEGKTISVFAEEQASIPLLTATKTCPPVIESDASVCACEGVTQCGYRLCGYRAECKMNKSSCRCQKSNDLLTELNGSSPSLWFCEAPSGKFTTTTASPNQNRTAQNDCNALTVGLAVGFGEALCLTVILFVVVVLIRKHWRLIGSVFPNINSNDNISTVETGHSYENVGSSSSLEESRRRGTGPRVETEMDMNQTDVQPIGDIPVYEDVNAPSHSPDDNETGGLYESANTRDTSGTKLYTTLRLCTTAQRM